MAIYHRYTTEITKFNKKTLMFLKTPNTITALNLHISTKTYFNNLYNKIITASINNSKLKMLATHQSVQQKIN